MYILKSFEEVSGLKFNYNKSKVYDLGVSERKFSEMARWMGCGIGEFPFTYLGLPVGENMRRVKAWSTVVDKFKNKLAEWKTKTLSFGGRLTLGLNIRSLRAKTLALLGKWWWRFKREGGSLWVRFIKSIYGNSGGLGDGRVTSRGVGGSGVRTDILKIGEEIDGFGIEFSSSYIGVLGDGRDIRFWVDRRVDTRRLCVTPLNRVAAKYSNPRA
ncbi:hypothetical protein Tco_0825972 [Tanacetum coccineum]